MMKQPTIPRSKTNPVGQADKIRKARDAVYADIDAAREWTVAQIDALPVARQNGRLINAAFYEYLIDLQQLRQIVDAIAAMIRTGSGARVVSGQTSAAYRAGIAAAVQNLAGMSSDYPRTVLQRLGDDFVSRRAAYAGARAFESMQGFSADVANRMGRLLYDAVQNGRNPRDVASDITREFDMSKSRALRIARTEITGALRRGRMDEAQDAGEKFGNEVMLIHHSALIPDRTRASHAARHGKLVTVDEQREWYSQNGNGINCLCSATEVFVKNGKPLVSDKLLERLAGQRNGFAG